MRPRCTCLDCQRKHRRRRRLVACGWCALAVLVVWMLSGCSLRTWRVFQRRVDGTLADTPAAQVEGQRRAASYIAQRSAPPVVDPPVAIADVHSVATGLSASLGEPQRPVAVSGAEKDAVIAGLRSGLRAKEAQLQKWKDFGRKYAGKPIEGTGIDLAGPAGLLGLAAVVALCIAVPPIGYLLLRFLPLLWGFFRRTTEAIGEFAGAHPEAGEELAGTLSRKMDTAHKRLVKVRASLHRIPRTT